MHDELLDEIEKRSEQRGQQFEDDPDNDRWLARHVGSLVHEVRSLMRLVYPDPALTTERLVEIMRTRPDDADIQAMNAEIRRLWALEDEIITVWVARHQTARQGEASDGE